MLFNSFVFLFAFLPITYFVFWLLRSAEQRYVWLTVTGYVFYGYWNPWFCLLMLLSTCVSYFAGLGMLRHEDGPARRLFLIVPVAFDLLLLAFFKYANFGIETAVDVVRLFGQEVALPRLDIVLPIGISFYTFHTISYIVDAYRRTITPTRNFFEFTAYVSLFSQLVAGPIVRFRQIEEDLESLGAAHRTRWLEVGVRFLMIGFVEKVILADTIAALIEPAIKNSHQLSTLGAWSAALGYTFQLYFDFSGYSSMAVGLGYLFGVRIPQNFNSPYMALDPSDFWKRWHISLSTCLRDYLYVPLGGNRGGSVVTYRNLLLTMLIGGLWHGANWTFIVWGSYHGCLLCLYRFGHEWWDRLPCLARQATFFLLVVIGWVIFRADNMTMAADWLNRMFLPAAGTMPPSGAVLAVLLAVAACWSMFGPNAFDLQSRPLSWKLSHVLAYSVVFGASLAIIAGGRQSPFLYFQF